MLTINLEFDSNAMAAPQSFRTAVQQAADAVEAAIYDPITVNIAVGYKEYDLNGPEYTPLNGGYSLGGVTSGISLAYPALLAALAANETSASDTEAVNSLPAALSLDGQSEFSISTAEAKALGVLPATDSAIDGYIGFPSTFAGNGLVDAGIVEIVHAMGMLDGGFLLSLFQYSGPGDHVFISGTTSNPAYFSIDGGNTNLGNYDVNFDPTLFSSLSNDPLSVPNPGATTLTPLDLTELGVVGFDSTSTPTLPTPNITPTPEAAGAAVVVDVTNVSIVENASISALSMIVSVAAPSSDTIVEYSFYDNGGSGSGYFAIDGVTEPDDQWIDVLNTQLTTFLYVGGATAGSQLIFVSALDDTTGEFSQSASLTVTTTAPVNPTAPSDFTHSGTSDLLMTNSSGALVLDQVAGGQTNFTELGGLGPEWQFAGVGAFLNDGNDGLLIRSSGSGALDVMEDAQGAAQYTPIGGLGAEWQFDGDADFLGTGQAEFLIRDTGTVEPGALYLGQVVNGAAQYTLLGGIGLEWQFEGTGDFLGDGRNGFLVRNTGSAEPGALDVGEIVGGGNAVQYTPIGGLGLEWDFEGTGNFLGDGNTGFLVWNSGSAEPGAMAIGEMSHGQLQFTDIGGVGPEWQFVGTGNYIDTGKTDFMLRNTNSGALVVGAVSGSVGNATVQFTTVGGVGAEWNFHASNIAVLS